MPNETVLIVEDEADLLENNCEFLHLRGYHTLSGRTLAEARYELANNNVDLVLLDVNLPDGSGFDFAPSVPPQVAILYLTGRTAEEDLVKGLSRGVGRVDYLRKPFSYAEMAARVAALLTKQDGAQHQIAYGPLLLDMVAQQATLYGRDLQLSPKEFALLLLLVQNEGKMLTKDELYESVWKQPLAKDGNALYMQISRLKKKLEKSGTIAVIAARGEGYMLTIHEK